MTITYFPRISDSVATAIIAEMLHSQIEELSAQAASQHPMVTYYETSVSRVEQKTLEDLRERILDIAEHHGFPSQISKNGVANFDREVARALDSMLDLIPAEAANDEVWNFLTLVLLPDIAKWRFPNTKNSLDFERWKGGHRNVFRKLWWREAVLGSELNSQIGEDESVGVMERPGLSSSPALARALVRAHLATHSAAIGISRSDFMRMALVNVRRHLPLLEFESFEETELNQIILLIFEETLRQNNQLQQT